MLMIVVIRWNRGWKAVALAIVVLTAWASIVGAAGTVRLDEKNRAARILEASGVRGGLIVYVGCGDPGVPAVLCVGNAYRVHAIDAGAAKVAKAREAIQSERLYGKVSADTWDGKRLPYVDNLVNLLVVTAGNRVPEAEMIRVLVPGGVALIEGGNGASDGSSGWRKIVKPWPSDIDQWTHWLHGADGNAVADDKQIGPPRHLQWIERPIWLKHHNATISFSAMVSAKGRVFYILDEAPPGLFGLPEKWALLARDAFNGTLLWKRKIKDWGWRHWVPAGKESRSRFDQPTDLQRRLIAVGDHVYAPLGPGASLCCLDAATGELLRTYAGTEQVSEALYEEGKLIVSVHRPPEDAPAGLLNKDILVFDAGSGNLLWKREKLKGVAGKTNELAKYTCLYLAAGDGRLFCVDGEFVVGMDLDSGKQLWRVPRPPQKKTRSSYAALHLPNLCSLVVCGDLLLFGQTAAQNKIPWNTPLRTRLVALSAKTGEKVWESECGNWGYGSPADIFVVDNVVWVHAFGDYTLAGLDLSTGKVKRTFPTSEAMNGPHHHRCYPNKATANFVLTARRGVEFLDLQSGENLLHHWTRGACRFGILPCNGLLYVPPDPCMCYATAKVNGLLALAARRGLRSPDPLSKRLTKGPAIDTPQQKARSGDWPTYRHDPHRSGSTDTAIGSNLKEKWQTTIGGRLSSVTVAGGKVFVASVDGHTVYALDETSGRQCWQYTTGGPVDSPPTFHKGSVLFGSADGHVYCLRASDGQLAWRFQAAPVDLRIVAFGQLASVWPVHGSVLVHSDVAYVSAGRSSFLDGGIRIYALDPATGRVLQERTVYTPKKAAGNAAYNATLRYDMPPHSSGALSDILVSDGSLIYMRNTKIDPKDLSRDFEGEMTDSGRRSFYAQKQTGKVLDFGPQVNSTAGLLDDSWFNQTFWSYAHASHSRLLVYDERSTYGLKAYEGGASRHARSKFIVGGSRYTLFADDRQNKRRRWSAPVPIRVTAIVAAGDTLLIAGAPDRLAPDDPWASIEGRAGGLLWEVAKDDGEKMAACVLESPPVWDGLAVTGGRVYVATTGGKVMCLGGPNHSQ